MRTILLAGILAFAVISVTAQSKMDLKLNLEKNKVYRFKSANEQTVSQTVNGIQQNTETKSNSTISIKMLDASPEFLVAEVRFDTMYTITNAMGMNTVINSASEGNIKSTNTGEVLSCIMNRLSKNPLYAKMNYSGKVIEIVNAKMLSVVVTILP